MMPREVIEYLDIKEDGTYVDCTFGSGGHSRDILGRLSSKGRLVSVDWDEETVKNAEEKFSKYKNFSLSCDNFANLKDIAEKFNLAHIDGIVFDLGFSSSQMGEKKRGFSFLGDAPLDMRYNSSNPLTAAVLLNSYSRDFLEKILTEYAQERFSKRIAGEIERYRKTKQIETTKELVEIIHRATPAWYHHRRIHSATRTFQAVRMAVNREIENIEKGLAAAIDALSSRGRIVVISFHSVEHRCVKNIFRQAVRDGALSLAVKKPVLPSDTEIGSNPRARSAQMRVAEKT